MGISIGFWTPTPRRPIIPTPPTSGTEDQEPINYVRNSVKAVVDAYDGTVDFYVADPKDPIVRVYQRIFPKLFKPLAAMPAGLQAHIRYPEDLFSAPKARS